MVIPDVSALPDIQNERDTRGIALDKVGVRGYKAPFGILIKNDGVQNTVGEFDIYCSLNSETKGANMSRFSQVINKALEKAVSIHAVFDMLKACQERLKSSESYVRVDFPYFMKKKAPVSKTESYSQYRCILEGRDTDKRGLELFVTVYVEYMSLCPCSRDMSACGHDDCGDVVGKGAHNQRSMGMITVSLTDASLSDPERFVWLEDLIELVERHASCPIWNTLKRPDEMWVTEASYKNPKFVEDVARDVAKELIGQESWAKRVNGFIFISEHHESIHQYDASCVVRGGEVYIP